MKPENIQQAIQDLELIRKAITPATPRFAWNAQLLLQLLGLALALPLVAYELLAEQNMAWALSLSRHDPEIGRYGLGLVALCIPFLLAAIYFAIWRAARHADQQLSDFLARNFHYLRNLSFGSDLLVKLAVVSIPVLAGQAGVVPALLTLFLGDYLLQGRYFILPLRASLLLGPLCFAAAGLLYYVESTALVYPLAIFAALSAASLLGLLQRQKA